MKNIDKFLKKYMGTSTSALKKGALKKGSEVSAKAKELKGDAAEYLEELGESIGAGAQKLKGDALAYTKKNPEAALKRAAAGAGAVGATVGGGAAYAATKRDDEKKKKRPY